MKEEMVNQIAATVLKGLEGRSLLLVVKQIEKAIIEKAMQLNNGNCTAAAKQLGINRTTLVEKRRARGLELL